MAGPLTGNQPTSVRCPVITDPQRASAGSADFNPLLARLSMMDNVARPEEFPRGRNGPAPPSWITAIAIPAQP